MSLFLRLLSEEDKAAALLEVCGQQRAGGSDARIFEVVSEAFDPVPGKPFAYWVSEAVRETFQRLPPFQSSGRTVRQGLATADDFRFVRVWWEIKGGVGEWPLFAKGGSYSPFYSDVYLCVNWNKNGNEIKNNLNDKGSVRSNVWMLRDTAANFFFRPGLTWPRRTQQFGVRVMPKGAIFADKGPTAFSKNDSKPSSLALLALMSSRPFGSLIGLSLNAGDATARSFEVGIIQKTPVPDLNSDQKSTLAALAHSAWSLKRTIDTIEETSHAFVLPAALRPRLGDYDPPAIEAELARIQAEIDDIAFDLYGFSGADRQAALGDEGTAATDEVPEDDEDDDTPAAAPPCDALKSWAVGIAFGRFDWRLATDEREPPAEPDPFDPLPAKSPGMLPDGAAPFHAHPGILVDEPGHPHDLARLVEEVLTRVDAPVPSNVRRWLQRKFFAHHLKQYSKSRRRAPIYWPLSTPSGSYTLWVYYPSLSSQTLYTAINDFIEPKLARVGEQTAALRGKGKTRTRADEKEFEALQDLEQELMELRDTLKQLAPTYKPKHDDGVQISAAPLWPLFRHRPWQKVLKKTWDKLEGGDYDWAHLAMNYWPERVREKCKADKSLAIAHGLESLYVEPPPKKKRKGRKKKASK